MPDPAALVRDFIVGSPYARLLGAVLDHVAPDLVRVRLPFRPDVVTVGDMIHGGALATVGFSINFLAAARGADVVAKARVIRRGRTLSVCDVEVRDASGAAVARALVTYKLG